MLGVLLVQRGSRFHAFTPEGQRTLEWARLELPLKGSYGALSVRKQGEGPRRTVLGKSVCNIKIAEEAEPPTLSFENYLAAVLSGKWRSLSTPSDRLLHLSPQAQSHARQVKRLKR